MSTEGNNLVEARTSSEKELRLLVETIPALVWRAAPEGNIDYVNKRLLEYLGKPLGEIIGWGWMESVHPDDVAFKVSTWLKNLESETPHDVACRFRGADGQYRWFEVRAEPLRASDGRVLSWYGILIDIDDRRKLQATLNVIPAQAWYASPSGALTFVNKRTADYLGLSNDHPLRSGIDIGAQWDAHIPFLHPDDQEGSRKAWSNNMRTDEAGEFSFRVRNAEGGYRWFLSRVEPLRASDGALLQWVGVNLDIEEFKRAEEALRESEYKLRQITEAVPGLIWSYGPDGEPTHINQRMLDYSGMRFENFKHRGWEAFVHPADFPETEAAFYHAFQTGTSYQGAMRLRRADGEFRWHHARCEPLRDRQGNIIQWYGLCFDIDEGKKAEDLLRRSEAHLAEAERLSHTGAVAYNGTAILFASEETYHIWGFDPAQGLPSRDVVFQRIHPGDREWLNAEVRRAVGEKRRYSIAYRILLPDGTVKHLETIGQPVFSASGKLVEIFATQTDVTERKRVEEALRESEYKLRQIIETVPAFLWSTGPDGEPTHINQSILDYSGLRFEDFENRGWEAFLHPDDFPETVRAFGCAIASGTSYEAVHRLRRSDGEYRWYRARGEPLRDRQGQIVQWYGLSVDIDEVKKAEDRLRESEGKFRDYAETASDWFWEIGPDYKFTYVSENAFGSNGADRIGTPCWDRALDLHTEPEKWRLVWATLDARKPFRDFVYYSMGGNGSPMYVRASGKPVFDTNGEFRGYRGTGTDATAIVRAQRAEGSLRAVEAELAHVNRVTTLGELAASIAHEVKQPIAAARNNARAAVNFLGRQPPDLGEVREALECIVGDTDRAGHIVDRIRDHIKKAPPRKDRFDLNIAINEVIVLVRSAITNNDVSARTRLAEGLSPVHGDRVQLQQVVLNLILNAVEAMSLTETGPRELLISTEHVHPNSVLVAMRDSGPGIAPQSLERVFDPFYTTKASGVGMGLSICRSIIDAHGGRLWADVNEPRGATFRFTVPRADGPLMDPLPEDRRPG